ncbi:glutamyl-tRNA reductase [Corynebacterium terpenotabidum]|uniref:Glutamyl-tRNA reductase n=1 Tax=Corynebacterium terpenotabidum Y-11 TaxID=1200352 RepID=S4XGJ9_9CORY|nr:glutamyl-tRNA reductase [Corynebacterium terpenotabidum]AGP31666.1 glutamyl-tRNA reductase [Corynebacterium terpenotabidum Y-11]
MTGLGITGPAAVLLVGLSFRSAPVPVLEKASAAAADLAALEHDILDGDCVTEAIVLSTCNRMEFYVAATAFHPALDHVVETVASHAGIPSAELEPYLYVRYADKAAEHMLTVASGLDSMVVGEQQIIGQLRSAYQTAHDNGTVGTTLHDLTQRALRTGKRVHTETEVDVAGSSMVSFALGHALAELGAEDMSGRRALVIGAGAMASLASTWLGRAGVDHVTVANRTLSRAENLADHARQAGVSADAVSLTGLSGVLADVDLVVSATGAVGTVLSGEDIAAAQAEHNHRMVLVDLSMPRDIDDTVTTAGDQVRLLNIEELTTLAGDGTRDEDAARRVVAEELGEYLDQLRVQAVVPTVKALRQRASDVIDDELGQLIRRTPGMSDQERAEVVRTVRRVVDKILHTPTVQVKKLSSEGGSVNYAEALAVLFNLPAGSSAAVSRSVELGDAGLARLGSMLSGEAS